MSKLNLIKELSQATPSKIVLLVIDGLGGLPHPESGQTELETAHTPNLDELAGKSICGMSSPVAAGITPGSAPGHLALFGYNPVDCLIGRGVLEALGIDFDLKPGDVATRGNFCTVDAQGLICDRRAGRVSSTVSAKLCALLDGQEFEGIHVIVKPVKDHRLVVVFRGSGLSEKVTDSDPQKLGAAPKEVKPLAEDAGLMARVANQFLQFAAKALKDHAPANMILLRGFSEKPCFTTMNEIYKLKTAAIASYPMYRGLSKVVGMDVLPTGPTLNDEIATYKANFEKYDFFFIHVKATDAAGEDGDFERKVKALEELDKVLPEILALKPDVVAVSGDHSTPAVIEGHSWHEVPVLIYSKYCRPDKVCRFSETDCLQGGLGHIPATDVMPLAMANALKLGKFGA
ncbi:MAG: 2,3-bisphosphoglycerate-independent phosphoglycerate mutase [Dehalococcoides mccartyi]|nr:MULTISPECIES: 2,3-bisphosphoglycerate-independent phosphoglycerate mutase [Dehalococcoides]MBF4482856.1 2,3-bisphosphoglycerate-independent phosphoglycerate mutase [Dehalococcoides mccartyi]MBJ7532144.1 2,3-bisphosphoglycerate-independent phosphoglycerate mutase [Dehalococcoides mccartyi]MDP4280068.1 2,3-bisphosphoglycerate-independent phosphoglycerate mutase [Dehalococcoides mccartyi]MEA4879314.1 2,3-bisphosphoglycerate-independent phosphoglycerate mutase [Dehalococcoides mccartyi]POZ58879